MSSKVGSRSRRQDDARPETGVPTSRSRLARGLAMMGPDRASSCNLRPLFEEGGSGDDAFCTQATAREEADWRLGLTTRCGRSYETEGT